MSINMLFPAVRKFLNRNMETLVATLQIFAQDSQSLALQAGPSLQCAYIISFSGFSPSSARPSL